MKSKKQIAKKKTEEVKNAEVVEEKQADAVAKEPAISTTEKI